VNRFERLGRYSITLKAIKFVAAVLCKQLLIRFGRIKVEESKGKIKYFEKGCNKYISIRILVQQQLPEKYERLDDG